MDEAPRRPEPQVCDVAAALLCLAPGDRRAFIPPLIAMLEHVVADEGAGPMGAWPPIPYAHGRCVPAERAAKQCMPMNVVAGEERRSHGSATHNTHGKFTRLSGSRVDHPAGPFTSRRRPSAAPGPGSRRPMDHLPDLPPRLPNHARRPSPPGSSPGLVLVAPAPCQQPPPDATWDGRRDAGRRAVDHRPGTRRGPGRRRPRRQGLRLRRRVPGQAARRRHPRVYERVGADRPGRLAAPRRQAADRPPHRA